MRKMSNESTEENHIHYNDRAHILQSQLTKLEALFHRAIVTVDIRRRGIGHVQTGGIRLWPRTCLVSRQPQHRAWSSTVLFQPRYGGHSFAQSLRVATLRICTSLAATDKTLRTSASVLRSLKNQVRTSTAIKEPMPSSVRGPSYLSCSAGSCSITYNFAAKQSCRFFKASSLVFAASGWMLTGKTASLPPMKTYASFVSMIQFEECQTFGGERAEIDL